jgi:hypothetical protein
MIETNDSPAFMSALVTEHFVLQSAASATIGESGSRAAIYLGAVSSGLVAIGFASASPSALLALISTVLPTVFLLGCFTIVRLVDNTIENNVARNKIDRIRQYYARLGSASAPEFFADATDSGQTLGVRYNSWSIFFTIGTMVAVVNSVLGGATIALILGLGLGLSATVSISIGGSLGLVFIFLGLNYQRTRFVANTRSLLAIDHAA